MIAVPRSVFRHLKTLKDERLSPMTQSVLSWGMSSRVMCLDHAHDDHRREMFRERVRFGLYLASESIRHGRYSRWVSAVVEHISKV